MSVLDDIIAGVRIDLLSRQARVPLSEIKEAARLAAAPLDPLPALSGPELAVIAEVKRKSPSKGALAEIAEPATLAAQYAAGGAAAISVLTEERRFSGTLADLDQVRKSVAVPVLRKDFMVDEYQFYEARAHGADLVLLIVAALDDQQLGHFHQLSLDLGMTALVETHDEAEVERALGIGARVIGVNNRNLKTLTVDLGNFGKLAAQIGTDAIKVAESGILQPADAALVAGQGADAVLVGEALVRHADPATGIAELKAAAKGL